MKNWIASFFFILSCSLSFGQQVLYSMSGNITDQKTGEDLVGVQVQIDGKESFSTLTNSYGFYSLTLPKGQYKLHVQCMGYDSKEFYVNINENKLVNINLAEKPVLLDDVTVRSTKPDQNISSMEMGAVKFTPRQIENIPVLFGEKDLVKTMQLLPGVKSAGDGNSGFLVRGGGIDQNLILLDEAPVYNPSHLMGFFSIFNSEAIRDANLMKGLIPAEYGGRASSVLDIRMKEGNLNDLDVSGTIGLISSNLTLEGPIAHDRSSFMLSARRTYADLFLGLSENEDLKNSGLYFYDLNLKTNWKVNERNRLFLSGYLGRDNFKFSNHFGVDWGSETATLRWNHVFSERLFLNTSLIYSDYSYNIDLDNADVTIRSEVRDYNFKQDFSFYKNPRVTKKFGYNFIYHDFIPGKIVPGAGSSYNPVNITNRKAIESAAYWSKEKQIGRRLRMYYGLRVAFFTNVGPGDFYVLDENGEVRDTTSYNKFKLVRTQGGVEPRVGFNLMMNPRTSIKGSVNRIHQFIHLLSNTTTTTPTDVLLPSSDNVKPQICDMASLGWFKNFNKNRFETSLEVYYKKLYNQIDYKNGADLLYNSTVESELVFGKGLAYGAEFLLKKNYGRLNGWVGYSWSKAERQFDAINEGKAFPARQDHRNQVSVVGTYQLTKKWILSASWVYHTGDAVTFPSGRYEFEGQVIGYYSERNGYRMPDYHRLDLGATWLCKKTRKFESSWNFSVYNAYARENAYYVYFKEDAEQPGVQKAMQVSLFKIIPSVSYTFKF